MLSAGPHDDVVAAAGEAAEILFSLGEAIDRAAVFPEDAIAVLRLSGLLLAPFRAAEGGAGLTDPRAAGALFEVLRRIGSGDLATGRLYEGHVNAVALVSRFGTPAQARALAEAVREGALSAVWNAEGRSRVTLERQGEAWMLRGAKILASGAGHVARPLVTAARGQDVGGEETWMVLPRLVLGERADLSGWTAQGMRASATGTIDLDGIAVEPGDIVGGPDDYRRQPNFFGGAWRFCAVQLGAVERLLDLYRAALGASGRGGDAYQRQRVAECAMAAETAALWVAKAARMVAAEARPTPEILAYVGLARAVTERAALDTMERVHRGIGLGSFVRPSAVERVARDLATYLRQPAPDAAMADAAATVLASGAPARDLWADA